MVREGKKRKWGKMQDGCSQFVAGGPVKLFAFGSGISWALPSIIYKDITAKGGLGMEMRLRLAVPSSRHEGYRRNRQRWICMIKQQGKRPKYFVYHLHKLGKYGDF